MDERLIEKVQQLRLMDDIFFNRFMQDAPECMEYVLNTILGRTDLKIQSLTVQYDVPNIIAKGVRFDAFCIDSKGEAYDFEVQNSSEGANSKRARRNLSMMDALYARKGTEYKDIPNICVIMFCAHDEDKSGEPLSVYDFRRNGTWKPLGDGASIIYVNGDYHDTGTELGRLISDFQCRDPKNMHSELLAKRTAELKSNGEEVANMCSVMEEYAAEKIVEAREDERKKTLEFATLAHVRQLMQNLKLSAEDALSAMGVAVEERPKYIAAL